MSIIAILATVNVLLMAIPVVALVDAARTPPAYFDAAGHIRTLWLVLLVLSIFIPIAGPVLGLVYLTAVRARLRSGPAT